jgi:hypothetical protein
MNMLTTNFDPSFCCESYKKTVVTGLCILSFTMAIGSVSAWILYDRITSLSAGIGLVLSISLLHTVRKLHITKSISRSADILKGENDKLQSSIVRLDEDLSMFKQVIGAVGEQSEETLNHFRDVYRNIKTENERHALLIRAQARIHFLTLLRHFDANNDAVLSADELQQAKEVLLTTCPNLDVAALIQQAQMSDGIGSIELQRILSEYFV